MHCCDQSPCMSSSNSTARLIAVCERDQIGSFDKHQIPIHVDERLTVKYLHTFLVRRTFNFVQLDETSSG